MWMDAINGAFEAIGAACVLLNVHRLHVDRQVRGVHWAPTIFFTSWGLWNVIYYPSLGQWWSTAGGTLLVLANLWWLVLVWVHRPRWTVCPDCEGDGQQPDMRGTVCQCCDGEGGWASGR